MHAPVLTGETTPYTSERGRLYKERALIRWTPAWTTRQRNVQLLRVEEMTAVSYHSDAGLLFLITAEIAMFLGFLSRFACYTLVAVMLSEITRTQRSCSDVLEVTVCLPTGNNSSHPNGEQRSTANAAPSTCFPTKVFQACASDEHK